jgi:hypothetical protein
VACTAPATPTPVERRGRAQSAVLLTDSELEGPDPALTARGQAETRFSGTVWGISARVVEPDNEPFKFPHLKRMAVQHLPRLPYGCVVIRALDRPDGDELLVYMPNRISLIKPISARIKATPWCYHHRAVKALFCARLLNYRRFRRHWRSLGESNPCFSLERAAS